MDATLDLITGASRSITVTLIRCEISSYHRDCKSHGFDWHRGEMSLENIADITHVLEPQDIDGFLDDLM